MPTSPLPQGYTIFISTSGEPLAGGSVFTYLPSTTTLNNTWRDPNQVALNTNPILLDANGGCVIFGWGNYRVVVKDSLGNTISDTITSGGPPVYTRAFLSVGSGTYTVPPGVYQLYVKAIGGGGGGASCHATSIAGDAFGAGGGAGGYTEGYISVTPGQSISYVTGAGGGADTAGGPTNFGSFMTCGGGNPGAFVGTAVSDGGTGGSATGGNILSVVGGTGQMGQQAAFYNFASGADSQFGPGGVPSNGATGRQGSAFGCGGGAAFDTALSGNTFAGGAGHDGIILIFYFT